MILLVHKTSTKKYEWKKTRHKAQPPNLIVMETNLNGLKLKNISHLPVVNY